MPRVAGVILIGGDAKRFKGADKSRLIIGSKTCLEWTLGVFENHIDKIALNVGQSDRYGHSKFYDIIFDWPSQNDQRGVALAILGSLAWAKEAGHDAIISTPVDTPLLPKNFVPILKKTYNQQQPSVYKTSEGLHGLHALWPVACFEPLKHAILSDKLLKISALHNHLQSQEIPVSTANAYKFHNVNSPEDLRRAEQYIIKP